MINKTKIYSLIILVLIFIIPTACVDEYWPELDNKYSNILVVDGMITNAPGPYNIKLSYASSVERPQEIPLSDYQVTIMDDFGNEEMLIEKETGTYVSTENGIQGVPGRKYKLIIISPHGIKYESDFTELKTPVEIKEVYSELEYRTYDELYYEQACYQFYVDTYEADEDTSYFLWRLTETYQYNADYLIRWKYGPGFERVYNSDTLFTCWKTDKIKQIFTTNTKALNEPLLERFPLHYVTTDTRHLSIRYSLLIHQLTIDSESYTYWNNLKDLQEQEGLFTTQPFQVSGNIRNVSDSDDLVLGYFTVAGISEKRIYQNRPPGVDFYYFECVLGPGDYEAMEWLFMTPSSYWPLYVTEDAQHNKAFPHQDCIDCTNKGGTIEKPDFWTD